VLPAEDRGVKGFDLYVPSAQVQGLHRTLPGQQRLVRSGSPQSANNTAETQVKTSKPHFALK
jgi:hypothetical protein